jgi:hypothetical protein
MKKLCVLLPCLCLINGVAVFAQGTGNAVLLQERLSITIGDQVLTAVLYDNPSARDFLTLLPVTVTMYEFRNREKYGHLPRSLVRGGTETHAYEVGDVIYSPVRSNLAFFYAPDIRGTDVPVIVMGKIDSGLEAFQSIRGTIEARVALEN